MKKKMTLVLLVMFVSLGASAQEKAKKWYDTMKFSGYGITQYQMEDKEGSEHNEFNLRLLRFILDGKIGDFDWRAQVQGTNAKGPGERIRVGQFKRPFTFENPTHPITQGWYAYAQVINTLSGFGDRAGEKSSGGRDIGIQLQGDILPNASGRNLLHYQVGVFNGEGINTKDKNQQKDIIGGLWVMPIEGVRIGAFGWTGSHGNMLDPATNTTCNVKLNRYALSAEYDKDEWTFRTEYVHSQGLGAEKVGSNVIDYSKGSKADGWYVFGIVPVIKSKLHAKARYNTYRVDKTWGNSKTMYEVGLNYFFTKNLQLTTEYARVNERATDSDYNFVDIELAFRF